MRVTLLALVALGTALTNATSAQQAPTGGSITLEQLAVRIMQSESGIVSRMRTFRPIVEVYVQNVEPHERLGTVPIRDEYFLGQFDYNDQEGPKLRRLTADTGRGAWLTRAFTIQLRPDGFAGMTVPDWRLLNGKRYRYNFVRREFLGEVRCLVLDVTPHDIRDGFTGRIWVEEQDFNVVRFNGISRALPASTLAGKKYWFNVDSWRINVLPGIWLPAYVYAEMEQEQDAGSKQDPRYKSQVRLWGYDLKSVKPPQELTTIHIGEPSVRDSAEPAAQLSPTMSHRMWEQQAEENVLERMSKAGLLAPAGEVDKVVETVAKNLLITNNITLDPEVRARVLLTSPLDSFTVGRTLVISRGLIDVLPDEASLAMMVAHELAHIALGHRVVDSKFAFADRLMVPDDELLTTVRYQHAVQEEQAADAKTIELLKNSPYKDKLAEAGLFMRAVVENSVKLRNLIQPHIVRRESNDRLVPRLAELVQQSPTLAPDSLDQIAALTLGARVAVDPWSSRVTLLRTAVVPYQSAREKSTLAVTPLVPYLRYAERRLTAGDLDQR